jgi:hypothetical protein
MSKDKITATFVERSLLILFGVLELGNASFPRISVLMSRAEEVNFTDEKKQKQRTKGRLSISKLHSL